MIHSLNTCSWMNAHEWCQYQLPSSSYIVVSSSFINLIYSPVVLCVCSCICCPMLQACKVHDLGSHSHSLSFIFSCCCCCFDYSLKLIDRLAPYCHYIPPFIKSNIIAPCRKRSKWTICQCLGSIGPDYIFVAIFIVRYKYGTHMLITHIHKQIKLIFHFSSLTQFWWDILVDSLIEHKH